MKISPLLSILAVVVAMTGCCSMTHSTSVANAAKLERQHLAFIDKYTVASRPSTPPALPASFENEVAADAKVFDAAAAAANGCAVQKEIFANDKKLFLLNVDVVRQQHYLTARGAANYKVLVRKNYEGLSAAP